MKTKLTIPPVIEAVMKTADHVDIKTVTGRATMREFIAGTFGYQPGWMTFLYRVRWIFVRFLGMKQEGIPQPDRLRADDISLTPGDQVSFLTVRAAEDDHYWLAYSEDQHLNIDVGVIAEPLDNGQRRLHIITMVHYNKWSGPVYFNVIRPFHHLVVYLAARSAANA
jgi:hypothetical protein